MKRIEVTLVLQEIEDYDGETIYEEMSENLKNWIEDDRVEGSFEMEIMEHY